jgi:hypothetical protein
MNHIAAECKHIHDTCGTCRGMHHSSDCDILDHDKFFCVNCQQCGHAAWDRQCNTFLDHNANVQFTSCYPENMYCFYPVSTDPDTWEMLDGPEISVAQPCPLGSGPVCYNEPHWRCAVSRACSLTLHTDGQASRMELWLLFLYATWRQPESCDVSHDSLQCSLPNLLLHLPPYNMAMSSSPPLLVLKGMS